MRSVGGGTFRLCIGGWGGRSRLYPLTERIVESFQSESCGYSTWVRFQGIGEVQLDSASTRMSNEPARSGVFWSRVPWTSLNFGCKYSRGLSRTYSYYVDE